jgi:glutathionyl-hydroquinone reductase
LADQRYLVGDEQTEADWRLFPTLMRFDVCLFPTASSKMNNERREDRLPTRPEYLIMHGGKNIVCV